MGIHDRVYNWLRKFLSIDALTREVRHIELHQKREVADLREQIAALRGELETFKDALRRAAERAPQRQPGTTPDFEAAQVAALDQFKESN